MTVGDNIKRIRTSKDLTQQGLADLIGLSRNYISELENNKRNLSNKTLNELARKLDVSVRVLIKGNETEQAELQADIESWQTVFNNHKMNLALLENLNDNEVYSIIETTKKEVAKIIEMINNNAEINLDDIKSELESLETALDEYEISKYEQSETLDSNIESNKRAIRLAENKLRELGAETTNKPQSN